MIGVGWTIENSCDVGWKAESIRGKIFGFRTIIMGIIYVADFLRSGPLPVRPPHGSIPHKTWYLSKPPVLVNHASSSDQALA